MTKKLISAALVVFMWSAVLVAGVGCEKEQGTFEKAGKKIDKAVDEAKDKMEDVGNKLKEKAEEAEKKLNK